MQTLIAAVLTGILAGAIDTVPMVVRKMPRYSIVSAFCHYLIVSLVVFYIDVPQLCWVFKGGVVALLLAVPMAIQVGGTDRKAVGAMLAAAVVLGTLIGVAAHYWA